MFVGARVMVSDLLELLVGELDADSDPLAVGVFVGGGVIVLVVLAVIDGDTLDEALIVPDEETLIDSDADRLLLPLVLPLEDALTLVDEEML